MLSIKHASRVVCSLSLLLVSLLLGGQLTFAQIDTGTILGTVKDQSGAVVPGATITVTNENTNGSLSTGTGSDGTYTITPIKIGTYTIVAEFQGFQKVSQRHLVVHVQQHVLVDFTLVPGQLTQTVEVTAVTPVLRTQEASTGQVVARQSVNNLPLNGRNYTFLAQLTAGVHVGEQEGRGLNATGSFSANGLRPEQNNYILDAIDNNNDTVDFLSGSAYVIKPPVDAIQEFKVQTSNFGAELGRSGGAVLNATIRSGTNQLHGTAWEFLRNDKLDAADFFDNAGNRKKGEFRRNQFGGAGGGPVIIPGVYNGKDRAFWFADYEGTRVRQGFTTVASVPTLRVRQSGFTDFSELITGQSGTRTDLLGRVFPLGTIFDPATTRTVSAGQTDPVTGLTATANGFARDPFSGNIIPASRLNPDAVRIAELYPVPTKSGLFNNFTSNRAISEGLNQFDVRFDESPGPKDQLFQRFSFSNDALFIPGPFEGIADGGAFSTGNFRTLNNQSVVSWTHTVSPTLVNEGRAGFTRTRTVQLQPGGDTLGIPEQFGIPGIPQVPTNGGLPRIDISGLTSLGGAAFLPGDRVADVWQASENFTKVYGKHTFKGGFEYQHIRSTWLAPAWPRGEFAFGGTYTEVPATGGGNTGLAQFLLDPTPASVPNGIDDVGGANTVFASNFKNIDNLRAYYATYFQDDWKVTPKLTLNLGLRWEYFGPVDEKFGAQANFLPFPDNASAGVLLFQTPNRRSNLPLSQAFLDLLDKDNILLKRVNTPGLVRVANDNFGPRFGFAYQVMPKLVVRGGYGLFYNGFENRGGFPDIGSNFPFLFDFQFFNPDPGNPIIFPNGSVATITNGLSAISLDPLRANPEGLVFRGIEESFQPPSIQEYNLAVQYQLTPNQSIEIAYVGNQVRHLETFAGTNHVTKIAPPSLNPQNFVPFPDFGRDSPFDTTQGNSNYNSLQVKFERSFSQGLNILGTYTWGKVRTDARGILNGNIGGFRAPAIIGIQPDFGLADFDVRNTIHLSGGYELPFGKGKPYLGTLNGWKQQMVGDWSVNWIVTLEDGQPFTIPCSTPTTAGLGCNALLVPGQDVNAGPHNVDQFLNPDAFTNPPVATQIGQTDLSPLGGAPTQAIGPGFNRWDFSIFKNIQLSERYRLEIRSEFFNILNHPNFSLPGFAGAQATAAPGAKDFTNRKNFGRINSTRDVPNDARQIQFALKLYF